MECIIRAERREPHIPIADSTTQIISFAIVAGLGPVGENLNNIFRVEDGLLKVSYADTKKFDGSFGHLVYKTPLAFDRTGLKA